MRKTSAAPRVRTKFNSHQLTELERLYQFNPRPLKDSMVALGSKVGLTLRIVQVWFQNRRVKERNTLPKPCYNPSETNHFINLIPGMDYQQSSYQSQLPLNLLVSQSTDNIESNQVPSYIPYTEVPYQNSLSTPYSSPYQFSPPPNQASEILPNPDFTYANHCQSNFDENVLWSSHFNQQQISNQSFSPVQPEMIPYSGFEMKSPAFNFTAPQVSIAPPFSLPGSNIYSSYLGNNSVQTVTL